MCGIITVIRKDGRKATKQLLKGYENQKARGTEGFGYVSFQGDKMQNYVRTENESDIKVRLSKEITTGLFFHHRTPTSTPNYKDLTHPIFVSNKNLKYDYYVIHNGIISNATELRTKHELAGYSYNTICKKIYETATTRYTSEQFNDSESLAIELAIAIDTGSKGIQNVKGSIATMILQVKKNSKNIVAMYYGRNTGNPLMLDNNKFFTRIASEGTGELLDSDILFRMDIKTLEITEQDFTMGSYTTAYSYDYDDRGYGNYGKYSGYRTPSDDDTEYDDLYEIAYQEYDATPKNDFGYVWLKGTESIDELAQLYTRYDYEIDKATASNTLDKQVEYQLKLDEVNSMLETLESEKDYPTTIN